eukprot:364378-Chlamydomonas_euryale.AAC.11
MRTIQLAKGRLTAATANPPPANRSRLPHHCARAPFSLYVSRSPLGCTVPCASLPGASRCAHASPKNHARYTNSALKENNSMLGANPGTDGDGSSAMQPDSLHA